MRWDGQKSVRAWAALFVALVVGTLLGAAYAALVGGVHRLIHGRWDRIAAFATDAIGTGAVFGLAVGAGLALAAGARRRAPRAFAGPVLSCAGVLLLAGLAGRSLQTPGRWPMLLCLAGLACLMAFFSLVAASHQPISRPGPGPRQRRPVHAGRPHPRRSRARSAPRWRAGLP